jgi:hypothetical protein
MPEVIYSKSSPYYQTPQTSTYLEAWQPPPVAPSQTDVLVEITSRYARRPDLLSFDLYGTPNLWWTFAMVNPDAIRDPINDMVAGLQIYVPSRTTLSGYL